MLIIAVWTYVMFLDLKRRWGRTTWKWSSWYLQMGLFVQEQVKLYMWYVCIYKYRCPSPGFTEPSAPGESNKELLVNTHLILFILQEVHLVAPTPGLRNHQLQENLTRNFLSILILYCLSCRRCIWWPLPQVYRTISSWRIWQGTSCQYSSYSLQGAG